MHTRDYVKSVFAKEGLYKIKDAKMASFLKSIDEAPAECWPEFIERFREEQYDLFEKVVPPLLFGKDRLVRTILARAMDPAQKKEVDIATEFIEKSDPKDNHPELLALVSKKNPVINKAILKRGDLSVALKSKIDLKDKLSAVEIKNKKTNLKNGTRSETAKTASKRTAAKSSPSASGSTSGSKAATGKAATQSSSSSSKKKLPNNKAKE